MSETATLENTTRTLIVHDEGKCAGEYCTIHKRSNHAMRSFPQNYRWDANFMERICPHGIGHPDPDDIMLERTPILGIHGCDGCCG
jgi:hypothetical protein